MKYKFEPNFKDSNEFHSNSKSISEFIFFIQNLLSFGQSVNNQSCSKCHNIPPYFFFIFFPTPLAIFRALFLFYMYGKELNENLFSYLLWAGPTNLTRPVNEPVYPHACVAHSLSLSLCGPLVKASIAPNPQSSPLLHRGALAVNLAGAAALGPTDRRPSPPTLRQAAPGHPRLEAVLRWPLRQLCRVAPARLSAQPAHCARFSAAPRRAHPDNVAPDQLSF
jgi:hypothetical protein